MDLNKDNKDIYTVDRDSYAEYMQEHRTEPRDLLSSLIKFLLLILLLVLAYFFYKIVKEKLSFTEVFNKKELISTYELLNGSEQIEPVKEDYIEVLAKKIPTDFPKPKQTVVLAVSKEYVEPMVVVAKVKIEKTVVIKKEPLVKVEKVKEKIIEEKVMQSEIKIKKEENESSIISESYLKLMAEELDSI